MRIRRGITLMETVIGTLLVGGVLAATLNLVGPTARSTALAGDQVLASYLADELLSEIEQQPFEDPDSVGRVFGPEPDEVGSTRAKFDDADDYAGWSGAPQNAAGAATTGLPGTWLLEVKVIRVTASDPSVESGSDTGVIRATVYVTHNGVRIHEAGILRTRSFDTVWEPTP